MTIRYDNPYIDIPIEEKNLDEVLDAIHKVVVKAGEAEVGMLEQRIRVLLQPKPRWWPEWLYRRMVGRLLTVEVRL